MPKVAQYGQSQVSTAITPGATARNLPGAAFNMGQAGFDDLATGLQKMQSRIDTTAAEEALVIFERSKNEMFFNPKDGYFNTLGRNAFDASKGTSDNLIKLQKETGKSLEGNARILYDRASNNHVTRANADIARHSAKQFQAWEVSTINATVENSLEGGSLYWNDPERLGVQKSLGRAGIIEAAAIEGVDPKEKLQDFESAFATNIIESATASSAEEGLAAIEKYGDALEQGRTVLTAKIETKQRAEKARDDSNLAVITAINLSEKFDGLPNELQLVNEEVKRLSAEDPDMGKLLSREVAYRMNAKTNAKKEADANTMEAGLKFQQDGGSVDQFIAQNSVAWGSMTTDQQNRVRAGTPVVTDVGEFLRVTLLPQEQLAEINPADYITDFSTADLKVLKNSVRSAREGTAEHQVGRGRSAEMQVSVNQLFGKKPKVGSEKEKKIQQFYASVTAEVEFRESLQDGKQLTSAEFSATLNDMTRKVVTDVGYIYDTEQDISELSVEDIRVISSVLHGAGKSATAENIFGEQDRIQQSIQLLRDNNIPVTEERLIEVYRQATAVKK